MAFVPLVTRIGALGLRQVAKPIASRVTARAHRPGWFRQWCLWLGQAAHRTQVTFGRVGQHVPGLDVKPVRDVDEERAIRWAADVMGELIVFAIALMSSFGVVGFLDWWGKEERERVAQEKEERRRKKEEESEKVKARIAELEQRLATVGERLQAKLAEQPKKGGLWS
eukprot:TRINITY_DN50733_c0_g1_i1.p2 TRINITY_DN50733_c0_g1~~TRINITY_DN50733_c0_g1_i1.p2  ORF type:complete len:194 (+),score=35.77 TRINITY_DN50733_c0_g1_i1:79-582(+)